MTDKDTAIRCQDYILELATKYDTVQMEVSKILQRTVKLALRRGWLKVSPFHACPLEIPMGKNERIIPTKKQMSTLLASVEEGEPDRIRNIRIPDCCEGLIKFGAFAGLRPGESCGFQWENIDLKAGELRVRHSFSEKDGLKETKTPSGKREIPMVASLWSVIDRLHHRQGRPRTGYVLANCRGNSIYNNCYENYFHPAMQRAGLVNRKGACLFDLHSLRHFFVSSLIEAGVPHLEIKRLVGHADLTVTYKVYAHLFVEKDHIGRPAMEAISRGLLPAPTREICEKDIEDVEFVEV
jgi:integrase